MNKNYAKKTSTAQSKTDLPVKLNIPNNWIYKKASSNRERTIFRVQKSQAVVKSTILTVNLLLLDKILFQKMAAPSAGQIPQRQYGPPSQTTVQKVCHS